MRRRGWAVAALAGVTGLLAGCVTPALDDASYRGDALRSVEAALSEAQTTRIVLQQSLQDRVLGPYANVAVTDSESGIDAVSSTFESVQPPTRAADRLRTVVTTLLSDTSDAIAQSRIHLRRDDRPAMRSDARALAQIAARLQRAEDVLR